MSSERLWFHAAHGEKSGPHPQSQLLDFIRSGTVTPSTLVWSQGMAAWKPLAEIPELQDPLTPPQLQTTPALSNASPSSRPGESMATAALVCAILGLTGVFCCGTGPLSIVAVILGHINLGNAVITPAARQRSRTALILGYVTLAIYIALGLGFFMFGGFMGGFLSWLRNFQPGWSA